MLHWHCQGLCQATGREGRAERLGKIKLCCSFIWWHRLLPAGSLARHKTDAVAERGAGRGRGRAGKGRGREVV